MTQPRIIQVAAEPPRSVRLTYADGVAGAVDLSPLIAQGGVFDALEDPGEFVRVCISSDGRSICWPSGIDLCADALRRSLEGQYQIAS